MTIDLVIRAGQILAALEEEHEGAMNSYLMGLLAMGDDTDDVAIAVRHVLARLAALGVDVRQQGGGAS